MTDFVSFILIIFLEKSLWYIKTFKGKVNRSVEVIEESEEFEGNEEEDRDDDKEVELEGKVGNNIDELEVLLIYGV